MKNVIHPYLNLLFLFVFCCILIYAGNNLFRFYKHKKNATKVVGKLIDYSSKTGYAKLSKNRKTIYAPNFSFTTKKGEEVIINSINFNKEKAYNIGDNVPVLYLEENPKNAILENNYPYKKNIYLICVGFIGLVITAYAGIKHFLIN